MEISAIVHTRNNEATLERALASLHWVNELLVVDMGSVDGTVELAGRYADRIFDVAPTPRVDGVRNQFIQEARHEWIFVLDSDEYLAEDAGGVLRDYVERHGERFDAFAIPRYNYIAGQIMRGSRWYPDHQIRLFRKDTVKWNDSVHRLPSLTRGSHRLLELKPPQCPHIHHHNYDNLPDFILKQINYAILDQYDTDQTRFDFSQNVAQAYEQLALRSDSEQDGDLSHALALVMAWDSLIRGLIHWDSLRPRPPLGYLAALPIATESVAWWRIRLWRWLGRHYSLRFFVRRLYEYVRGLWWRLCRKNP